MSMLTAQINELREKARLFEGYQNGEISRTLRYAADTIELLRERLQAATFRSGTLTAEQVREAIWRHVKFYEGGDYDEQAIADELNAELGKAVKR